MKKNAACLFRLEEIIHSGVTGMKWGERRYQYEDGRLTPLGKIHYGVKSGRTKVFRRTPAHRFDYVDKRNLESYDGLKRLGEVYRRAEAREREDQAYRMLENEKFPEYFRNARKSLDRMRSHTVDSVLNMKSTISDGKSFYERRLAAERYGFLFGNRDALSNALDRYNAGVSGHKY